MSRWLSLLSAFGCLLLAGVAYAATPSKPQKKEKPFTARLYYTPPAPKLKVKTRPLSDGSKSEPRKRPSRDPARPKPRRSSPSFTPASPAPVASVASVAGRVGPEWEETVQYYSGGSYGVAHINKLASKAGNGGVSGDRQMVAQAASRHGIPFALLWGTYGAESSYGTNTGGGAKPPYFGLTQAYPGPPSSPYRGTSGNFAADAAKAARSWAKNYKLKTGSWPSSQAARSLG